MIIVYGGNSSNDGLSGGALSFDRLIEFASERVNIAWDRNIGG